MRHRPERLGQLILEQLNALIVRELEFPGALVTLLSVEVTDKLDHARVKFSVLPPEKEREAARALEAARHSLQHQLMKKLRIRTVPHIAFELDHGNENAAAIEKVIIEEGGDLRMN